MHQGILPLEDLYSLSQCKVVVGVTDDGQRELGMINNRVFEVLSCETLFISDSFPELKVMASKLGVESQIRFYEKPGDVTRHLTEYLQTAPSYCDILSSKLFL